MPESHRLGRRQRLTKALEYSAVYGAKIRKSAGPIVVFAKPNGLEHSRLGLAVGRRAGGAVQRNRLKRLIREAFRLDQHALPLGFDFVVSVRDSGKRAAASAGRRNQAILTLAVCRRLLSELGAAVATEWDRRVRREAQRAESTGQGVGDGPA